MNKKASEGKTENGSPKVGVRRDYEVPQDKGRTENTPHVNAIRDGDLSSLKVSKTSSLPREQRGMATIENTLNSMTGDISYEDLTKIPGISVVALRAKESVGEVSIFQRKDYVSSLKLSNFSDISYQNIPLISQFVATNARIVPSRISYVDPVSQKFLEKAVKVARYLGLLKYVDY